MAEHFRAGELEHADLGAALASAEATRSSGGDDGHVKLLGTSLKVAADRAERGQGPQDDGRGD